MGDNEKREVSKPNKPGTEKKALPPTKPSRPKTRVTMEDFLGRTYEAPDERESDK